MSRIQKALNDLATDGTALFESKNAGSEISLSDDGSSFLPIKVTIDDEWFTATDLRHAAKLFNKIADSLETQGRGD